MPVGVSLVQRRLRSEGVGFRVVVAVAVAVPAVVAVAAVAGTSTYESGCGISAEGPWSAPRIPFPGMNLTNII